MKKKNFFIFLGGIVIGVILTIVYFHHEEDPIDQNSISYLDKPVRYENKDSESFLIHQVYKHAAIATQASNASGDPIYFGKTVLIIGENFYSEQEIKIKSPQRIGSYNIYDRTVPVISGTIVE